MGENRFSEFIRKFGRCLKRDRKSLYAILIELSESHCKFTGKKGGYADLLRFNLDDKTISNGNTVVMKNGKLMLDKITLTDGREYNLKGVELISKEEVFNGEESTPYERIDELFEIYKHSVPSAHSQFSRQNFKALKADELTMEQLINNMPRIKAQYMLEAYILLASLAGYITWAEDRHWFSQSKKNKELILYKSWIKNNV